MMENHNLSRNLTLYKEINSKMEKIQSKLGKWNFLANHGYAILVAITVIPSTIFLGPIISTVVFCWMPFLTPIAIGAIAILSTLFGVIAVIWIFPLIISVSLLLYWGTLQAFFYGTYKAAKIVEYQMTKQAIVAKFGKPVVTILLFGCNFTAKFTIFSAKILHGYEVKGFENIYVDKSAILVFHNTGYPLDMVLIPCKIFLSTQRITQAVAYRSLFWMFPWALCVDPYISAINTEECARRFVQAQQIPTSMILELAPGGTQEAFFSSSANYETIWGKNIDFAKIAQQAKVDIIPVFTRNQRQVYFTLGVIQKLWRPIYNRTGIPFLPVLFIGFPVKLITYVGQPIAYNAVGRKSEALAARVQQSMETLIEANQTKPASIIKALFERLH